MSVFKRPLANNRLKRVKALSSCLTGFFFQGVMTVIPKTKCRGELAIEHTTPGERHQDSRSVFLRFL